MSSAEEYERETCWTADELRAIGFPIPDTIPGIAWIPRTALVVHEPVVTPGADAGTMHVTMSATFTEPFRWLELNLEIGRR